MLRCGKQYERCQRITHRSAALREAHSTELAAGKAAACGRLIRFYEADHAADGLGGTGVVPCDDHHPDTCTLALGDGGLDLR